MIQRNSIVQARAAVTFPQFAGERHYMIPFLQEKGLPANLSHWQPTVDAMLEGIESELPIYLMIDQKFVRAGEAHRRPGIHVDGYWNAVLQAHGTGPTHGPTRLSVTATHVPDPRPPSHLSGNTEGWADASFKEPEAIILASDVTSALAYRGKWSGAVGDMGDCSHLDVSHLKPVILQAGTVFAGNAAMLHESVPVFHDCYRTVVRLNVPGYSPELH